jgi:parallel beta-helix repeat protein
LKLTSDDKHFSWIKAENSNIIIRNTKITSWDEKQDDFDRNYENGRSYILQKSNGRMDILDSELAYLGYYGYPNRGNPYGGPYGVSWKIQNGSFKKELSTGMIRGSRIHDNLFGVYTYGVTGVDISQNEVYNNIEYGLDPHDDSNHMLIADNDVHNNGNHGIITSKRCFANIIRGNHSYSNELHGIMLDRDSNNNLVENNYTAGNINGIALYHSSENIIQNNHFADNQIGVRANNFSLDNYFGNNSIENNKKGVYMYDDAYGNVIVKNHFSGNTLNFHFKNRSSNYRD